MFVSCAFAAVLAVSSCGIASSVHDGCRTVTLQPGDNFVGETVVLTDSVRYVSAWGARSRIVGGRLLKAADFRKVTDPATLERLPEEARGKVYVCDFKSRTESPSVFIGGRVGAQARWPNEGSWMYVSSKDVICPGVATKKEKTFEKCAFVLTDPRAKRWNFAAGVRMKGYWTHDWCLSEAYSDSFGAVNGTNDVVTFTKPIPYGLIGGKTSGGHKQRRYFVYDLLEELDAAGEYYYDDKAGKLYLAAPEGLEKLGEIAVSDSKGPLFEAKDVDGIVFEGVDFAYCNGGFLKIKGGRDHRVDGCTFTCCGGDIAIAMEKVTASAIRNSKLTVLAASGILLDGGDRATLRRGDNIIENCQVLHFSIVKRTYRAAVRLAGVGNTLRGCELAYAPHMAVAPVCNLGVIEYNDIHDVLLETGDCGALYTGRNWHGGQGQVFRYNHIHDLGKLGASCVGIYFDDAQAGGEVYGNVFENMTRGILIGGGRDHLIHDNIFRNCSKVGISLDVRGLVWPNFVNGKWDFVMAAKKKGVDLFSPVWQEAFPRVAHYLDVPEERFAPLGNEIHDNLFVDCPVDKKVISLAAGGKGGEIMARYIPRLRIENNYSVSTGDTPPGGPDPRATNSVIVLNEKIDWPLKPNAPIFEKLPELAKLPLDRILTPTSAER